MGETHGQGRMLVSFFLGVLVLGGCGDGASPTESAEKSESTSAGVPVEEWGGAGVRPIFFGADGRVMVVSGDRSSSGVTTGAFVEIDPAAGEVRPLAAPPVLTSPAGVLGEDGAPVLVGLACGSESTCDEGEIVVARYDAVDDSWSQVGLGEDRALDTYSAVAVASDVDRTVLHVGGEVLVADGDGVVARFDVPAGTRDVCQVDGQIVAVSARDAADPEAAEAGEGGLALWVLDDSSGTGGGSWMPTDVVDPDEGGVVDAVCGRTELILLAQASVGRWDPATGWDWADVGGGPSLPVRDSVVIGEEIVVLDGRSVWTLDDGRQWREVMPVGRGPDGPLVTSLATDSESVFLYSASTQPSGAVADAQLEEVDQ